jgi:hypothetical protein
MDIRKIIQDLYAEKEKLDRAIASPQNLQPAVGLPALAESRTRRGRKSMSEEERKKVSLRMKTYWSARRRGEERSDSTHSGK